MLGLKNPPIKSVESDETFQMSPKEKKIKMTERLVLEQKVFCFFVFLTAKISVQPRIIL